MRHRRSPRPPAPTQARPRSRLPDDERSTGDDTGFSPTRLDADGREHRRDGVVARAKGNALVAVRRRELALGLLAAGAPRTVVVRTLEEQEEMSRTEAGKLYLAVCDELRSEYEDVRPYLKAQQVERLQRDLANMRATKGSVSYRSIAQHEALLARITGTVEPVRTEVSVDATVRESLVAVVGGMDRERMDALVAEQLELEERAGRPVPALDVPGEPVEREPEPADPGR